MTEREKIFSEVVDEVLGYGPLEPLLKDPTISDILVNTFRTSTSSVTANSSRPMRASKTTPHLMRIIDKIVSSIGRRVDESSPWWTPGFQTARGSMPSSRLGDPGADLSIRRLR